MNRLPAGSGGAVLDVSRPLLGLNYTNIIKYETLSSTDSAFAVRRTVHQSITDQIQRGSNDERTVFTNDNVSTS